MSISTITKSKLQFQFGAINCEVVIKGKLYQYNDNNSKPLDVEIYHLPWFKNH